MISRLLLVLLLFLFSGLDALAADQYALECRGGGDLVTFYRHTHNNHAIVWKFQWSQNESAQPRPGECRYLKPVSGYPRPYTLFYRGKQKDGYGVEFTLARNHNAAKTIGPDTDLITRYLIDGSQSTQLIRFCVTYEKYPYSVTFSNIQYAKGFIVKKITSDEVCN